MTTPDGTTGTLVKGWVSDFLDVPGGQQFYSFVTTLVSNGITAGVGGGNYGVDQATLRQQMAVFLLKAKHGLCFVPPPCTTRSSTTCPAPRLRPWINELVAEGFTGGCGGGTYCPASPVLRQQMAVLLLQTLLGTGYTPPACTAATFTDVPCSTTSPRGSTTSSPAASPPAAAAASTAHLNTATADRWPSSSSRLSGCNDPHLRWL